MTRSSQHQAIKETAIKTGQDLFWTASKFAVVGLGSIAVYFAFLLLLEPIIANLLLLTSLSYVLSAVFNYSAQRWFTFKMASPRRGSWLRYIVQHAICMALNSALMLVLVDVSGLPLVPAQLMVTAVVAAVSFVLSYRWVYR